MCLVEEFSLHRIQYPDFVGIDMAMYEFYGGTEICTCRRAFVFSAFAGVRKNSSDSVSLTVEYRLCICLFADKTLWQAGVILESLVCIGVFDTPHGFAVSPYAASLFLCEFPDYF